MKKEKLQDKYTTQEIVSTLRKMVTNKIEGIGYKQLYKKTEITTDLNNNYDFDLDQKFISLKNMHTPQYVDWNSFNITDFYAVFYVKFMYYVTTKKSDFICT